MMDAIRKISLTYLLFFIISPALWSQSVEELAMSAHEKGDKYFNQFAYKKAITFYEQSFHRKQEDSIRGDIALKIASSYTQLNQPQSATIWFEHAEKYHDTLSNDAKLQFAKSLAASEKYAQASKLFQELVQTSAVAAATKSVAKQQLQAIQEQKKFFRNAANISISKAPFNSEYSDFAPLIYDSLILFVSARDQKSVISTLFHWDESNYLDIFSFNPSSQEVKKLSKRVNTPVHEGPLTAFNGNNDIIFTRNTEARSQSNSNEQNTTKLQLYHASLEEGKWSKGVPLAFNNPDFSYAHPSISEDGSTLYFSSDCPGGIGGADLYLSKRDSSGNWGEPQNLGLPINSAGDEFFPTIHKQVLYFASTGHGGLGGLDLFAYDISSKSKGEVINLGAPLNSSLDDFSITFYENGRSGYFSSNREKSAFKDEIYQFSSEVDLLPQFELQVLLTDKLSQQKISEAELYLLSSENDTLSKLEHQGNYFVSKSIEPNLKYKLLVNKKGYHSKGLLFSTLEAEVKAPDVWQLELSLVKEYEFGMTAYVYDAAVDQPIDAVKVSLINNLEDTKSIPLYTDEKGQFNHLFDKAKLNQRVSFQIKLEKEGYLGKTLTYNTKLDKPGIDSLNTNLNFGLDKIEIGADIGKLIDIQPIYFDLGKAVIRADAAKELDKIVKVMEENPTMTIELGSHTDARGSDAFNLSLSDKRAKASAAYIVSKGIDEARITGKGYGETQLINDCHNGVSCSEESHQLNRRTEFKVLSL